MMNSEDARTLPCYAQTVPIPFLTVESHDVSRLFQTLQSFLSPGLLSQKIAAVERELRHSPPITKQYWTVPQNYFWLGLRELRRASGVGFSGVIDPRTLNGVLPILEVAAQLRLIEKHTPLWKLRELRSRILNGSIAPSLIEISAACNALQRGFSVEWIESQSLLGLRSPEMLVRWSSGEFEVECKSQSVDASRKIRRRAFYQMCDGLLKRLSQSPIQGVEREIKIDVPDRFEVNENWQELICSEVVGFRSGGEKVLANGVTVRVRVRLALPVPNYSQERLREKAGEFGQAVAAFGRETVIIICRSSKPDRIVKAIESDLSDACRQLSQRVPARIYCYVPEITSFEPLKSGSALQVMTNQFFARHPGTLHSVVYISDSISKQVVGGMESVVDGLTFPNPHFVGNFPDDVDAVAV